MHLSEHFSPEINGDLSFVLCDELFGWNKLSTMLMIPHNKTDLQA